MSENIHIFISYAHEDEGLLKKLEKHLTILQRQGLIETWHDRKIKAGTEWVQTIDAYLNTAQIILLLISANFLASEYCYSQEMKRALERHENGNACVIPIILRPVFLNGTPFNHLQALPLDAKPITKWANQDDAFVNIIDSIQRIIENFVLGKMQENKNTLWSNESNLEPNYVGNQIGEYTLLKKLGSGTYGQVYWGKHNMHSAQLVAIKLMHAALLNSPEKQEHFLLEYQLLHALKYPYILPVINGGVHEGLPYIVVEYAPNGSLRELLDSQSSQPLPIEKGLAILSQIGQALDYAHQHNVIHRDLKPRNILFDKQHNALLADFSSATILTTAGSKIIEIAGTPEYMAPEQFAGNAGKESDQYALGCIAYELFTGHTPFNADGYVTMWFQHVYTSPLPLTQYVPTLPLHIEKAVLKALMKEPEKRHYDIPAFLAAMYNEQSQVLDEKSIPRHNSIGGFMGSGYIRRLPIYLLIDCSEDMAGDPIINVNEGMSIIYLELMRDPQALETVYISVITFASQASQYQLTPLDAFVPPQLSASGERRAMGDALRLLVESIEQDLVPNTAAQHGDFRPLVFLLTNGSPTDHFRYELQKLKTLRGGRKPVIVALECGSGTDTNMLLEITENVFPVQNITPTMIKSYVKWISHSLSTSSTSQSSNTTEQVTIMAPPTIPGITYSPSEQEIIPDITSSSD